MPSLTFLPSGKGMSSAQTQTRGSEAKHIRLPTHARQQKSAQENPCAVYRVKKQTAGLLEVIAQCLLFIFFND